MTLPPFVNTPRFLRLFKLIFYPLNYLDDYGQKYGDIFAVGNQKNPLVYVSNPQGIQAIFSADKTLFKSGGGGGFIQTLLGDNSLLLLQGEKHQRERKLLTPPFHGERLQTYGKLICDITQDVTQKLKVNQSFLVREVMQDITLKVILQAVFGLYSGERYEQLQQLLGSMLEFFSYPGNGAIIFFSSLQKDWGNWTPWGRFLRTKAKVDELLYAEIRERRQQQNYSGDDILTLLMLATDETAKPMSDEELHDELITLLIAGHETTASTLSWALYWIHYYPKIEEKLRSHLLNLGEAPNLYDILKLPYLEAICNETLRIYPVVLNTFFRMLQEPLELMGYQFEPGTVFAPSIYLVHHREDIYPQPKQFRPERFLEKQFSPYEYLPFGGGIRRCIGMELAKMEMKLVLATILSQFCLKLTSRRSLKPVRRGLTVAPPTRFKMVVCNQIF
ncbi:cytochrome P450 [Crocosphaera sp. UHCC 0190]|uniref:cytochrome P450 n=1 Tax=Crocosphaera sp. UHCC 0190 TaxID=3110246 RepID=UPI002B212499|nr:cytochrome P450 [Crocosphaera sp. UHCC 0190]MEA5509628.1 cytochrome P450 [Crocosphaera sp. UHCC 0190]